MRKEDEIVIITGFLENQKLDFEMKLQRKSRRRQELALLGYNVERSLRT